MFCSVVFVCSGSFLSIQLFEVEKHFLNPSFHLSSVEVVIVPAVFFVSSCQVSLPLLRCSVRCIFSHLGLFL